MRGFGANKEILPNSTQEQGRTSSPATQTNGYVSGVTGSGFTLTAGSSGDNYTNDSGRTYVGWCWKAGGAPTATNTSTGSDAPTSGSVMIDGVASTTGLSGTIKAKKISANTTAGFSIVQYSGNSTGGATVDHGLTQTPEFIWIKNLDDDGTSHAIINTSVGTNGDTTFSNAEYNLIYLDSSGGSGNNSSDLIFPGNNTTFALGSGGSQYTNGTADYIAYLWHSVEGYSKVGSYTGNANADGPFVYLGFKPAFVLFKNFSTSGYWNIRDSVRGPSNPIINELYANTSETENTNSSTRYIDFLANGFKIRSSSTPVNGSGNTLIYIAFAENPFGGENTPPATAR